MSSSSTDTILHQWDISPFCTKIRKILNRKGIAFDIINYNGLKALSAPKLSDAGMLPVLDFQGARYQDSSQIAAALDHAVPDPALLPEAPEDRARARILEDWADESLYFYEIYLRVHDPVAFEAATDHLCASRPGWERVVFKPAFRRKLLSKIKEQGLGLLPRDRLETQFLAIVADLDAMLEGRDWLVGDRETIADIAVSSQIDEVLRTSSLRDRVLAYENVAAWIERGRETTT